MTEKKVVSKEKVFHLLMLGMFFKILFTGYLLINLTAERHDTQPEIPGTDDISFHFAPKQYPVLNEVPAVLHIIILDSRGNWIDNAEVNASLRYQDKELSLDFYHVEDGLYESRAIFSSHGDWTGEAFIYLNKEHRTFPLKISVL
ncbi:hypothetical protein [Evansella clarkii]|uniref:hypothetical protein n=1 Tax=Evansella clarkii TaxID=79879 RepID=UPI0009984DF5|nr:hypothetical protein [Evansella clarkii]